MEFIQKQLNRIEQLLTNEQMQKKEILSVKEASIYLGQSTSSIYKLTSKREIPFYVPNGKIIYFKRAELDDWIFQGRIKSLTEEVQNNQDYISRNNLK